MQKKVWTIVIYKQIDEVYSNMTNKGESVNKCCTSYDSERRNICDEESSDRPSVVPDKLKSEVLSKNAWT